MRASLNHGCACRALGALLCLLWLLAAWPAAAAGQVRWVDYPRCLQTAKKENRHLMIFFSAPWCFFCKKMQRLVFPDQEVSEVLGDSFVAAMVDVSEHPKLRERYGAVYVPTTLFLDSSGREVLRLVGYVPTERFRAALGYVAGGHYAEGDFASFLDAKGQ